MGDQVKLFKLVFLLGFLFSSEAAFALPSVNTWTWPQILDYTETQAASPGSGCKVWLESYGTSSYRLWKRCGVSSTSAGTSRESVNWNGWSGTIPGSPGDHPAGPQVCFWSVSGSTLGASCDISVSGTNVIASGFSWASSGGTAGTISNPQQQIYEKIVMSCVGIPIAGSVSATSTMPVRPTDYHSRTPGTTNRVLAVNSGSISSTCFAADTLVKDFGDVAGPTCTASNTVTANVRGRVARAGDCGCIPQNFGIDEYYPPNTCLFRNVVGDPASLGSNETSSGSTSSTGYTFTNADLPTLPSGVEGVPTFGGEVGAPDNWGMEGTGGHTGSAADSGTGFKGDGNSTGSTTAPGTGSSGGGGSGGGTCTSQNCNDDGTEDAGSVPGVPTYDTTITPPESGDWVLALQDFITGSPIVSALSGSAVTASSTSCDPTMSIYGRTIEFNFCTYASALATAAPFLLILSHLAAFWIIWRF